MPTEQPDGNIRDLKDFKDIQRACCKAIPLSLVAHKGPADQKNPEWDNNRLKRNKTTAESRSGVRPYSATCLLPHIPLPECTETWMVGLHNIASWKKKQAAKKPIDKMREKIEFMRKQRQRHDDAASKYRDAASEQREKAAAHKDKATAERMRSYAESQDEKAERQEEMGDELTMKIRDLQDKISDLKGKQR